MPDFRKPIQFHFGTRNDFDIVTYCNRIGLAISVFQHGGTHQIRLGEDLMLNQVEGHPLEGGLHRAV